VNVIFGGYGRKTKVRGEVFFPCMRCEALNVFGLVENYGYGQLYGLRLAKYKTNRLMLCSQCQDGYGLEKNQWEQAMIVSNEIKGRNYELSLKEMAELAVWLAREVFPDIADDVRELLAEQFGEAPAITADNPVEAVAELESGDTVDDYKTCPDCAEMVKAAARKCRFCGYRFDDEVNDSIAESED
jgi:hypothetical protein